MFLRLKREISTGVLKYNAQTSWSLLLKDEITDKAFLICSHKSLHPLKSNIVGYLVVTKCKATSTVNGLTA